MKIAEKVNQIPKETIQNHFSSNWKEPIIYLLGEPARESGNGEMPYKCPFHDDKNPSFSANWENGRFICQGCGKKGDIIQLWKELRNMDFPNALADMVKTFGISEPKKTRKPTTKPTLKEYSNYVNIPIEALQEWGLRDGKDGVEIPYKDIEGKETRIRKRITLEGENRFLWGKGKETSLYGLWLLPNWKEKKSLFIVEGESDCQTLWYHDIPALGIPGKESHKKVKDALECLKDFEAIYYVEEPDAAETSKKIARYLKSIGKPLHVIKLKESSGEKDPRDLRKKAPGNFLENWEKAVSQAIPWKEEEKQEDDVEELDRYFEGKDKKIFVPLLLAEHIQEDYHFRFATDCLFVDLNGVYRPEGEKIAKQECQKRLKRRCSNNRVNEVYHTIIRLNYAKLPEPDTKFINVKNGLLDWENGVIKPHDPKRFDLVQIPVEYDPQAKCPEFDRYLETTLPEGIHPLIEEVMGYCLIPYTRFEKAVMLTGSGSNGKSVFLDTLNALLGKENCSNVTLQDLEENRFKAAELLGKMANIFADLPSKSLQVSSMFKTLVTGDTITAERKHGQPFKFSNFAKLLFSANEIPKSRDRTKAFYRRWLIIPFEKCFEGKQNDKTLRGKLSGELPGILNRALNGLKRLFEQNDFTEPAEVRQALESYQAENDTVAAFTKECVVASPDSEVSKQDLKDCYEYWCKINGFTPAIGNNSIPSALKQLFPQIESGRPWKEIRGKRPMVWRGISFSPEGETTWKEYITELQKNEHGYK